MDKQLFLDALAITALQCQLWDLELYGSMPGLVSESEDEEEVPSLCALLLHHG